MPAMIKIRGKLRWQGRIQVKGKKFTKLFRDNSLKSKREATAWELETRDEVQNQLDRDQTPTTCLSLIMWAELYLDDCQDTMTANTYGEKARAFRLFIAEYGPDICIKNISAEMVNRHLIAQMKARSGNAANKDRKNMSAAWVWGCDYISDFPRDVINPFKITKKMPEKRSPRYVPPESEFWKVHDSLSSEQDQTMLKCFLYLAARRKEIFNLTWEDVDFPESRIRLWTSKREGGSTEFDYVPMIDKLRSALLRWWQIRPVKDSPYVFTIVDHIVAQDSNYGQPFKYRQHFMKRVCRRAGVKPFGFHAIRHLSATILFHDGVPLAVIQAILRHKSPETTRRNLRSLGLGDMKDHMEKVFGKGEVIQLAEKRKV